MYSSLIDLGGWANGSWWANCGSHLNNIIYCGSWLNLYNTIKTSQCNSAWSASSPIFSMLCNCYCRIFNTLKDLFILKTKYVSDWSKTFHVRIHAISLQGGWEISSSSGVLSNACKRDILSWVVLYIPLERVFSVSSTMISKQDWRQMGVGGGLLRTYKAIGSVYVPLQLWLLLSICLHTSRNLQCK